MNILASGIKPALQRVLLALAVASVSGNILFYLAARSDLHQSDAMESVLAAVTGGAVLAGVGTWCALYLVMHWKAWRRGGWAEVRKA